MLQTINLEIAEAVSVGLSSSPKRLPSWLFYDETGDKIFQAIMRMPEYYLTRCEYEILQTNKDSLLNHIAPRDGSFKLVELGAGDGLKTQILLEHFVSQSAEFSFNPVDVSESVLSQLEDRISASLPLLEIKTINKRYYQALRDLQDNAERKLILFLGANIGNFNVAEANKFVSELAGNMSNDDLLLVGFDLKKDPRLILAAYDDKAGITREFNLNLLARMNRDLGADFDLEKFKHYPYYDPETGITKSYLVSQSEQDVYFEILDKTFHFDKWEVIHTEVSQKYDLTMIKSMAAKGDLHIQDIFYDSKKYFCDVLLRKPC